MPRDGLVASERATPDADFDRFFRAQLRPLVALAYGLTGSRSVAEDLAQDALLATFKRWTQVGQLDNPARGSDASLLTARFRASAVESLNRR